MTDREQVQDWVAGYRRAWESNAEADIRALFTDDAEYRYHPYDDDPVVGIDAIVANWLENRDEPGTTTWELRAVHADGDTGFVQGVTEYLRLGTVYDNLWVIRLAADGRAHAFTEWYMKRPPVRDAAAS
jgi:ketosteroid isomerase-like protein